MDRDDFWMTVSDAGRSGRDTARWGILRIALLYGTAVIAVVMLLAPMLSDRSDRNVAFGGAYDAITTGSISSRSGARTYTVRRSVTQRMPDFPCIVDGSSTRGEDTC